MILKIKLTIVITILISLNNIVIAKPIENDTIIIIKTIPEIKGTIFVNGNLLDTGYVILFSVNNPSGSCFALDTAYIGSNGTYSFSNFLTGYSVFIIKAFPANTSSFFSSHLPTYYDTKYKWTNALPIIPTTDGSSYDIHLISLSPYTFIGNSSISGNVSIDSNSIIKPIKNSEVLLINTFNNEPIAISITDINGNYAFNNLPYNTYSLFVEISCKIFDEINLTLNYLNPTINGLNFILNQNNVLYINENSNFDLHFKIFPNPFSDALFIEFESDKNELIKIKLLDQYGRIMQIKEIKNLKGYNKIKLNTSDFSNGIYYLQVLTSRNTIITKKIIKNF